MKLETTILRKLSRILVQLRGKNEKERELIGKALYELNEAIDFYSNTTVGREVYVTRYDC